jgi:hypothetical protein
LLPAGLHDVWNLAWKLDLFLYGHSNEQLLDSYSAERLPVIKNVIETTDFLTKAMGTPNRFAQAAFEIKGGKVSPHKLEIVVGQTVFWKVSDGEGISVVDKRLLGASPKAQKNKQMTGTS